MPILRLRDSEGNFHTVGINAQDGASAYEIAVNNGFIGTEDEWLTSLTGVYYGGGEAPDWAQVQIDPSTHISKNYNPVTATDEMTQPVGVNAQGRLFTAPSAIASVPEEVVPVAIRKINKTIQPTDWVAGENGSYTYTISDNIAKLNSEFLFTDTRGLANVVLEVGVDVGELIFITYNLPETAITVNGLLMDVDSIQWGQFSTPLDAYPVNSIIMRYDDISPASIYGGGWEKFAQGRMPIGVDGDSYTAGSTGGNEDCILTLENIPEHSHKLSTANAGQTQMGRWTGIASSYLTAAGAREAALTTMSGSSNPTPIDTMPPYIAVYFWRRYE